MTKFVKGASEGCDRPSHHRRHKSRVSLRGPPCALGVSGIPYGEVRDNGPQILLLVLCFLLSFLLKLSYEHGTIGICRCDKLSYPIYWPFFVTLNSIPALQSLGNFLHMQMILLIN
jgi:hypothetical protein